MSNLHSLALLLQSGDGGSPGAVLGALAFMVVVFVAMWKVFTKAGQPGWALLIPIYNGYVLLKIVGRPGWWLLLFLIPLVNFIIAIVVNFDLARSFGKGAGFALGLTFLSPIFYIILGLGAAEYEGPAAAAA
jgi:hypothetical protein